MRSSVFFNTSDAESAESATGVDLSPRRPRSRVWLFRVISLLLAAIFSGILLEIGVRCLWDGPPSRVMRSFDFRACLQRDAELGWIPRPSVRVDYPPFGVTFWTNADGLRGPRVPRERAPGRARVMVLGDSFAWGHGVSEGAAFCEVLARRMPDVEFVNLGVPGFNLRSERSWFERVGRAYRPDVVIVALCQNDIRDFDGPTEEERHAENAGLFSAAADALDSDERDAGCDGGSTLRGLKGFLNRHSAAYAFAAQLARENRILSRLALAVGLREPLAGFEMLDDNLHASLREYPSAVERAMRQARRDLERLTYSIRAAGARPMLALIPPVQAVDADAMARTLAYTRYEPGDFDFDKPMLALEAFARELGMASVNSLSAFRAGHAAGRGLYLPGDLHFNSDGHELFAESLAEPLRELLERPAED